jgi:hypothetical protein
MSPSKHPGTYLYLSLAKTSIMPQEPLSGTESLQIIEEMIRKAKNQFSERGHLYILWGWVIFICCIGQYILINVVHSDKHFMVWLLTWVLLIYQIFFIKKRKAKARVKTYTQDINAHVWTAFVASLFLTGLSLSINTNNDEQLYFKLMGPIFLAFYGIPTFLSGIILSFPSLKWGGIACWCLSLIACFVPSQYQLLLLAVAVVLAWIIPGYRLQKQFNQNSRL